MTHSMIKVFSTLGSQEEDEERTEEEAEAARSEAEEGNSADAKARRSRNCSHSKKDVFILATQAPFHQANPAVCACVLVCVEVESENWI